MMNNNFLEYASLPTERPNKRTLDLDRLPLRRVLEKLNREDCLIPKAVKKAIPQIERAARAVSRAYLAGGKIFFIGAGTSGRLGALEAAELPPTYGIAPGIFRALMAGGDKAIFRAKEGAEDNFDKGRSEILKLARGGDVVIAVAASGVTPYTRGGLTAAKKRGALTVLLTCNPAGTSKWAAVTIALDVGPEPIAGSTRMKSGTATKLALNMISTSAMIISGKVYRGWMVDVKATSQKLRLRAERITSILGGVTPKRARELLQETRYCVKTAVVMARLLITRRKAQALIKKHNGFLKAILG